MRPPRPWFRTAANKWCVQIDGRQHTLAVGRDNRAEADRRFHELMALRGTARPAPTAAPTVGSLVELYLIECRRRVEANDLARHTEEVYAWQLESFAERCGNMRADALKPKDVLAWLDSRKWGPTSRHHAVGTVKAMTAWAANVGHLSADPLARMRKPPRADRRRPALDAGAAAKFFAAIVSDRFRDLMTFLHQTGCRPGEAMKLEARHIDAKRAIAVMVGKTTRKTGKPRVIHLGPAALALCARLATEHPEGPIFRNEDGNAWTKDSVNKQVRRLRERAGMGAEAIAYAFRHLYVTDALDKNVPIATVAELVGHTSTTMIARTYSHLSERHEHLKEALGKVRPEGE